MASKVLILILVVLIVVGAVGGFLGGQMAAPVVEKTVPGPEVTVTETRTVPGPTVTVTETVTAPEATVTTTVTEAATVTKTVTEVAETITPTPMTSTPTPTPTPTQVLVEIEPTHSGYISPQDIWRWTYEEEWYRVVGVVVNRGDVGVFGIIVTAKFYDSDGRLVAFQSKAISRGSSFYPFPATLPSGCKIPFKIDVTDTGIAKLIASYSLSVSHASTLNKPQTLKITEANIIMASHNEQFHYKDWRIVGTIKNEGATTAEKTYVMCALYNQNGKVVGVAEIDTQPENIPEGEEGNFSLKTNIPETETVTSAVLFAESDQSTGRFPF